MTPNSWRVLGHFLVLTFVSPWIGGGQGIVGSVAEEASPSSIVALPSFVALNVTEQGTFVLPDRRELCLQGVWVPGGGAGEWRSAWRDIANGGDFSHRDPPQSVRDRYGCMSATVENADGVSLELALVTAGWAAVDPLSMLGTSQTAAAMLAFEAEARDAGRGIWTDPKVRVKAADKLTSWIGTRQLVEGRVQRVSSNDRYVYLNFGADWRTDFTARLDHDLMDLAGFDIARFDGRMLRLRGVIEDARGPLMTISHPQQIELLP